MRMLDISQILCCNKTFWFKYDPHLQYTVKPLYSVPLYSVNYATTLVFPIQHFISFFILSKGNLYTTNSLQR